MKKTRESYEIRRDEALAMMRNWSGVTVRDIARENQFSRTMARRILDRMTDEGLCKKVLIENASRNALGIAIYYIQSEELDCIADDLRKT